MEQQDDNQEERAQYSNLNSNEMAHSAPEPRYSPADSEQVTELETAGAPAQPEYRIRYLMPTNLVIVVAIIAALIGGIASALIIPYLYGSSPQDVYGGFTARAYHVNETINVKKDEVSPVTAVAFKLQPSVVNIRVKQEMHDSFHPDVVSGAGSGVIFTKDGYIITNNHVVAESKAIYVTIGTDEVKGVVVAADQETDLAVIKVDKEDLPAADFGSSKDLQIGELAVAIGSPFGFERTVTSGIISAKNRTVTVPDEVTEEMKTYTNLIQTDAPINPGNSGGALSDAQGKVIGINTLIISSSGMTEGVGFAIPVETAVEVAKQLISKGAASHPYIGIMGQNADNGIAGKDGNIAKGALVVSVIKGGPSEKAGLQKNDLIVAADKTPVDSMDDLIAVIRLKKVGESIDVTVVRAGKRQNIVITLVEKPKS